MKNLRWLAAFLALIILAWLATQALRQPIITFDRPGGGYRIEVLKTTNLTMAMPGQGSDAPGVVRLLDDHGKVLQSMDIEMVQLVDHVEWRDHSVWILPGVEWPLSPAR